MQVEKGDSEKPEDLAGDGYWEAGVQEKALEDLALRGSESMNKGYVQACISILGHISDVPARSIRGRGAG